MTTANNQDVPLCLAEVDYEDERLDVYAFLIQTPSGPILVDTGVGSDNAYIDKKFNPRRVALADALAEHQVQLQQITTLVNSHLHFDHCGNNQQLPQASIVVQAAELAAAREANYTVKEWFDYPQAQLRPVSGPMELMPGVHLLPTPGHTPGHQSVLVETQAGGVLIAAQAAFTAAEFARGGDPATQAHPGLTSSYLESIAQLQGLNAQRVLFSHDISIN